MNTGFSDRICKMHKISFRLMGYAADLVFAFEEHPGDQWARR